ncbi:MAG: RHS repeat-associated core domain-containing protein [Agriterribacter sp.]
MFISFLFCLSAKAQLSNYRYWYDNDFKDAQLVSSSDTVINFVANTTNLANGNHAINFQSLDSAGNWSSVSTINFSQSLHGNLLNTYRYWYDNDFKDAQLVSSSDTVINFVPSTMNLSYGKHAFNFQSFDGAGNWSSVSTDSVQIAYQQVFTTPQNAIKYNGNQLIVAEPIQLGTGTYYLKHRDINVSTVNGSLEFTRFYNSLNSHRSGTLGFGWSHSYNYFFNNRMDTAWDIYYPDGHICTFIPTDSLRHTFPIFRGTTDSLQRNNDGSYTMFTKEKLRYDFDAAGKLDSIVDLNDDVTRLYYTGTSLDSVVGPGGRSLKFTHSGNYITSVKGPLNRIINYSYDTNGNLISVTDANSGSASFTYDTVHRMLTSINPLGNIIVSNTYDDSGRVIMQQDAYNNTTSIQYNFPNPGDATVVNPDNSTMVAHHDAFIRKTSETDELGYTKTFSYDNNSNESGYKNEDNQTEKRLFDDNANELSDTLPGSKVTNITYNAFNSPVLITDANGNIKRLYYDSSNNLDSVRFPDNSLQVYYYNSAGQVTKSVDGNGNATSYTYSPAGDLLTIKTAAGIKRFGYDAAGRKISSTDEDGHVTRYEYDGNDNLIKITDPLGRTIESTYDANNQLLSVKDKKGFVTSYTYDKKGRKTTSTNPKGGVTTYTYDSRDNLIAVTDPDNKETIYTYDAKGRKTSVTNALGTTQYHYDGVGNLIQVTDATGKTTEYSYTPTNKKQAEQDGFGNTTQYGYDHNDNLISVTDALNRTTTYGYDAMNRLTSVIDPANKPTTVTYDKNGNRRTLTDPNGHTQRYTYDAVNRLVKYQDAAGNNYAYSYDSAGNNITLTKPTGTITKVFDAANRVTTVNNSTGDTYHFTYDNNDNIVSMRNNAGTTQMVYDSLNNLTRYQDPFSKTVSFTYDKAGNKTSLVYPGNNTVMYTYDGANNLKTVTDWLSHTFNYSYDAAGRLTQLLYPNGTHCDYTYDNAGRLISKVNGLSNNTIISSSAFTLDADGNRISEKRIGQVPTALPSLSRIYSYTNDNKMLSDAVRTYANDNSGNRISETNGVKSATYSFSVDNLLNTWTDTSGNSHSYSYDPLGHRISNNVGVTKNRYVLDASGDLPEVLQITDGAGVLKSNFVYGRGLLERIDVSGNPSYYHFDAQHNTTALTNQSGVITDDYTYDPFGTLLNHKGTTVQQFTFLGEYGVQQESSSLYFARARYYDAANGRFLSKDAYPSDLNNPQTVNRYVYGMNDPLINYDPSGLFSPGMLTASVFQYARGTVEYVSSFLVGETAFDAAITGNPIAILPVIVSADLANNGMKDFNAGNYNLINSFTPGNSINDAKFAEDPDISGIPHVNDLVKQNFSQNVIKYWTISNAIVSFGSLFFSGNISNIATAYKNLGNLPNFAKSAISGSVLNILEDLNNVYKGLETLSSRSNSNCNQ